MSEGRGSVGADPCVRPRVSFLSIMPGQGQAPAPVRGRDLSLWGLLKKPERENLFVCRGRIHATPFFHPLQGPHVCGPYTTFAKAESHCRYSGIAGLFQQPLEGVWLPEGKARQKPSGLCEG